MYNFGFYELVFNHIVDHILPVLPYFVLYNMVMGLEALYLGYVYSILFWVRTLACFLFSLVDIWFLIYLMDYRKNFNVSVLYGVAGVIVFVWVLLGAIILIKYRFGKVKKVKITFIRLLAVLWIRAFKGLLTCGKSVIWRYFLYESIYSSINSGDTTDVKRESLKNFSIFIIANYFYGTLSSIIYFLSLRYVSARLLFFGHFSGVYSKGFIILVVGDILECVLGFVFVYRLMSWIDGIDYTVFMGSVNAL